MSKLLRLCGTKKLLRPCGTKKLLVECPGFECVSCGSCCFSTKSKIILTIDIPDARTPISTLPNPVPISKTVTMEYWTSGAIYTGWKYGSEADPEYVYYRCAIDYPYGNWGGRVALFPDDETEDLIKGVQFGEVSAPDSGNVFPSTCCSGSIPDFWSEFYTMVLTGTGSIEIMNNKCCRCNGGDCVKTSNDSYSICDGDGINTCLDSQDDTCNPAP